MLRQRRSKTKYFKGPAGTVGISSGTVLLAFANGLPENSKLKLWLMLIAPSVTFATTAAYLWAETEIRDYLRQRKLHLRVRQAKSRLIEILNNSNGSEQHRAAIRKKIEEAELDIANLEVERIATLHSSYGREKEP